MGDQAEPAVVAELAGLVETSVHWRASDKGDFFCSHCVIFYSFFYFLLPSGRGTGLRGKRPPSIDTQPGKAQRPGRTEKQKSP
jgi:hypothetical protein